MARPEDASPSDCAVWAARRADLHEFARQGSLDAGLARQAEAELEGEA